MAKSNDARRVAANEALAVCHSIRTSPRKLNLVAQSVRGLDAAKAVAELSFSKKRIAKTALAVLQSAIANAENNHQLNIDKLFVKEAYVGVRPTAPCCYVLEKHLPANPTHFFLF